MPLHVLCERTGVSQERILEVLAAKSPATAAEMERLNAILEEPQPCDRYEPAALPLSVTQRLHLIRELDAELNGLIDDYLAVVTDASSNAPPQDASALARCAYLAERFSGLYAEVSADLRDFLRQHIGPETSADPGDGE